MRPYVAHITINMPFDADGDPGEEFIERYREIVDIVMDNHGMIEYEEDYE